MQPRQNSMVWMAWCMNTSESTNWRGQGGVIVRGRPGQRLPPTQEGTTPTLASSWSPGCPAFSSSEPLASGESRSPVLASSLGWGVDSVSRPTQTGPTACTQPLRGARWVSGWQRPHLLTAPPYLQLASTPQVTVVIPAKEQGCAKQQDGHCGQGQDHQCRLHYFLQGKGPSQAAPESHTPREPTVHSSLRPPP